MKRYKIIKMSTLWSATRLAEKVEEVLNKKSTERYEIVSVSFGINALLMVTAYITVCN